jgi:hypothetical protein
VIPVTLADGFGYPPTAPSTWRTVEIEMASARKELIERLRRLAAKTKDANRERTLLSLAERLEAGEDVLDDIELLLDQ